MSKFFARNINTTGRVLRALWGLGCFIGAGFLWNHSVWGAGLLAAAGAFSIFEALRGWCVMRACGVRTRY